ncbi:MAG: 3-keto-disaccharide hydrolase [Planctomycetota bacterium]
MKALLAAETKGIGSASADSAHNRLTAEELADGWILLFDGETLFGWQAATKTDWSVADGAITAESGEIGLLHTTCQFGNYELTVDFQTAKDGNSGVFLRTSPKPSDKNGRCYEVNIAPARHGWPTGSIVQHAKASVAKEPEGWHRLECTADGGRFIIRLDGEQVVDYTHDAPFGRGYIGLQYRTGKIAFRNIKLKPLGGQSLFNGKDLSGWRPPLPESKSVFSVTPEGWLHVKNGRGMLETEGEWADFTLQLECFVNGAGLNSGVFFRCIPGEVTNGYECQISNAYKDGDRTKPVDCGTGGIFRRQEARKVVADDFQWFHLTLHADYDHTAAWVNGYQVSDWTDTRAPDPNPRKGLRLAPGTMQLQGHDPTTDISFRNLRVFPLADRESKPGAR